MRQSPSASQQVRAASTLHFLCHNPLDTVSPRLIHHYPTTSPWTALLEVPEDYIGTVQPNQLEEQVSKCQRKNAFNYQKGDMTKPEPSTSATASHEHSNTAEA